MLLRSLLVFLLFFCGSLAAQKNIPYLVISGGPGYFLNGTSTQHYVNRSTTVGISYLFNKKKKSFIFNPGLNYAKNSYHTHMSHFQLVQVKQRLLALNLDLLMRITKKSFLRVGLLISKE